MKTEYLDNKSMPPGNGFLVLSEELFSDGPWKLTIQRASDKKYLSGKSANQWVGETALIDVPQADLSNGKMRIPIGPDIVDSLDQKDQYRVNLLDASQKEWQGRLRITSITHSMGDSASNTARVQEKTSPPSNNPASPTPKPVTPEPKAPPKPAPEEKPLVMEEPEKGLEKSGNKSRLVLPVLALLALICLAWWYFAPQHGPNSSGSVKSGNSNIGTSAGSAPPKQSELSDAEKTVREFFAGSNLTPVNALALARSLTANTPAQKDAIYRLYYYAASSANPAGLLEYGNCIDPSTPAWGTIEKNGVEAWQIYEKARKADPQKAEAALDRLKKWLEEQSSAGNAQAKAWLGSITK